MLGVWLAQSVMTMFSRRPDADIAEALAHADRALAIAPDNPVIMSAASLPHRLFGNAALALDLAQRANAAGGGDALFGARFGGNGLWASLIQAGREEEAIEGMLASRPPPEQILSVAYAALGRWDEALMWAQRATATYPNSFLAWANLANALAALDRLDEARDAMRRVTAMVPTFTLAYYDKGARLGWRNREKIVESQLAGLRRLEAP
ncbi:MAG TPA: tetratricopeptide repeat protein [Caulobacteraceae bacterium]|nr:tetratricopeptide repeat protein [Caulobacteraceae bacterium]